jgi:uncharacterized membrane protein
VGGYPGASVGPRRRGGLRWLFVGIGATFLLLGVVALLVAAYPGSFGFRGRSWLPFGGGFLGVILVLWGSLVLLRVAMWSSRGSYGRGPGRRFDPAILAARQRYARGEITREQFHQIVRDLRGPRGPPPSPPLPPGA